MISNNMINKTDKIWECGSDFHTYFNFEDGNTIDAEKEKMFLGTGRYALRLIIDWGRSNYGWKRIFLPSYFCPDVIESVLSTGIITEFYYDDPVLGNNFQEGNYKSGDVILINNLFGYRSQPDYSSLPQNQIQIIEDHSHDPWSAWSINSRADWCFASLRKSFPVSDGAILWSPKSHQLPPYPKVTIDHYYTSLEKYTGMLLKAIYLLNMPVDKELFRSFIIKGEKQLGTTDISDITEFSKKQIFKIPVNLIRQRKNQNRLSLSKQIKNLNSFQILEPAQSENSCPFSVILCFNSARIRKIFLDSLTQNRIYPAILWPVKRELINDLPSSNSDFSEKMLSIHCDFRYSNQDMNRVGETIIKISDKVNI